MKRRPPLRKIRRVVLYLRVSSDEQVLGHSLDSQRAALIAWAESEGWEVVAIYEDAGASGTSITGRPQFQRLLAAAQAGIFDAVLVLKFDRFARSVRDATSSRDLLRGCGVHLLSRTEPNLGDDTPAGFLLNGQSDLFNAYYSVQLSDNVTRGKHTRALKGLPLGDLPFGYISRGAQFPPEIVPEEAAAVVRCFERYATGNCSMAELAEDLNAAEFRPRSKRGRTVFSKATIHGMLSNPTYVGDITRHGEVVAQGRHQPIVSRELWDKVQAVREQRARRPQVYGARPKRPYLFSGVGICASCASPLWANTINGGRHNYYRCASRARGDGCPDAGVGCRAEPVEDHLSSLFARLRLPPTWRDRVRELVDDVNAVHDIERERRRLQAKIVRVRQGLIDGVIDNETAKAAVREAEAVLTSLIEPPDSCVSAGDALVEIYDLWPHMTETERRDLVRTVLADVVVDLRQREVAGMMPKPAFAPLFKVLAEVEGGLISVCGWRPRRDSNPRSPP